MDAKQRIVELIESKKSSLQKPRIKFGVHRKLDLGQQNR